MSQRPPMTPQQKLAQARLNALDITQMSKKPPSTPKPTMALRPPVPGKTIQNAMMLNQAVPARAAPKAIQPAPAKPATAFAKASQPAPAKTAALAPLQAPRVSVAEPQAKHDFARAVAQGAHRQGPVQGHTMTRGRSR